MSTRFAVMAFDADDTLWHSENLYALAQARFNELLSPYCPAAEIDEKLYRTEMSNLPLYGYGIKSFALSMIQAAIEMTDGCITGRELGQVITLAQEMIKADVQLLEHVEPTLARLSGSRDLMLITKGDLRDQESKFSRSGIAHYFRYIEIVSDKTRESYAAILSKYQIEPSRFLMVGNSLRSDIVPVLALGGQAVYIPYRITWAHEAVNPGEAEPRGYFELEHLGLLPELIESLDAAAGIR